MQVLDLFASISSPSTFSCLKYLQIHAIIANTYMDTCIYVHEIHAYMCKYVQIDQVVFACICQCMHVYASICMYLEAEGGRSDGSIMNGQYLYVFACTCMYFDSV